LAFFSIYPGSVVFAAIVYKFFIDMHNMKTYGRVEVYLNTFITSAPDGGE
jgi:hypothetical protein